MDAKIDRKAFRDLSYGLYIVTSLNNDQLNGQVVNTIIQVTSDPPRIAVIINKKNLTHEYISKSRVFAASVLDEAAPMTFFGPFGFRSGREVDKLSKVQYKKGITGAPMIIDHALSVMEAKVFYELDLGTHTIFVADVVYSEALKEGVPLTYHYYHRVMKGKSSPNAPTFTPEK